MFILSRVLGVKVANGIKLRQQKELSRLMLNADLPTIFIAYDCDLLLVLRPQHDQGKGNRGAKASRGYLNGSRFAAKS